MGCETGCERGWDAGRAAGRKEGRIYWRAVTFQGLYFLPSIHPYGHPGVNSIALLNILLLFLLSFTGCPTVLENSIEYSIAQLNWPPGKLSRYCNKYKTFCVMVSHKLNPWNVLQHVRTNCMNWSISSQCQKQPIYSRQLILWLPRDKAIIVFVAKG